MGTTLAEVEREVAARCGGLEDHVAVSGTVNTVVASTLASAIPLGGQEDKWVLRRSAPASARARRVLSHDPATGTLTVDRNYAAAEVPVAGEAFELVVLDPVQELRPAVVRGLARCFFVDRVAVPVTAGRVEESLSKTLFWVVDVGQLRDVSYRLGAAGTVRPSALPWYEPYSEAAGVGVGVLAAPGGSYVVEALRPHATWVNGKDAPNGPTADADALQCPLDYAAAAGHVEAWRRCRPKLGPMAQAGLTEGLASATSTFETLVRQNWWYWDRPDRIRVPAPSREGTDADTSFVFTTGRTWEAVAVNFTWSGLSALTWSQVLNG